MVLGRLLELLAEVRRLVVEGDVEAELVSQPLALVVGAAEANDARALDLGNLRRHAARGAGSARNNNRLSGLGVADGHHAHPGGQARHAQRGKHVLGVLEAGVVGSGGRLELAVADDGVLGPTRDGRHEVADSSALRLGGDDAGHGAAAHDGADGNGLNVRSGACKSPVLACVKRKARLGSKCDHQQR